MTKIKAFKKKLFHKYLFFDLKPSIGGIVSLILGGISIVLIIIGVAISYAGGGNGSYIVGCFALISLILAGYGIYMGFRGLKEEEKAYLPCKIGIILCGCICAFVLSLFAIGI